MSISEPSYINRFIDISCSIAIKVRQGMMYNSMNIYDLSEKTGFSIDKINMILDGIYNLDLKDISTLSNALNCKLLEIINYDKKGIDLSGNSSNNIM
jgi:hypothetical protein